ncbi:hypothetical protein OBV_15050 [Oscillibacter valericigenes Sjm18-20]|nr:hypothetical protein OBV_15050 [Oscillibacter valericigenes Sjm18-20]
MELFLCHIIFPFRCLPTAERRISILIGLFYARLGYDSAAAWRALLRKQRNIFAEQKKISPENLR